MDDVRSARAIPPIYGAESRESPNVLGLFSRAVALHAHRTAVCGEQAHMSYAELDARSTWLATRLSTAGAKSGSIVGILAARSPETIVALLAVLKCGAAYLPFDIAAPTANLQGLIDDCNPVLILADEVGLAAHGSLGDRAVLRMLSEEMAKAQDEGGRPTPPSVSGHDPAYVMYTSGSTGKPKGVVVPHRAIVRLVDDPNFMTLSSETVMLHMAPLAFDASTLEIYGPLLNGGKIAVISDPVPSLDRIAGALADFSVNTLWLTAGLFHIMVETKLSALKSIKQLLAGGDVLSPTHVRRALDGLPDCTLINGYGPTENTTFTCCYTIPRSHPSEAPIPIGVPISGTSVHILDGDLRPVPDGEEGQLCAGGEGVALGYLNRADETAQRFIADPIDPTPGRTLYLTGDVARRRPDGVIEFLGRLDRQVKIDGKRVELDEIENVLRADPRLADAVVTMRRDGPAGARRIVAFIKPAVGIASEGLDARVAADLRDRLAEHMVPKETHVVVSMPLTANGKVDRNALIAVYAASRAPQTQAPVDGADTANADRGARGTIDAIWREVLGAERLDAQTNLFELGATSLMMVGAHERIQARLDRRFSITEMFAHPTIAGLAAFLEPSRTEARSSSALTAMQQRGGRQRALLRQLARPV